MKLLPRGSVLFILFCTCLSVDPAEATGMGRASVDLVPFLASSPT
jgi:hypothetical protein